MSQYLVISKISIQNANSIAGFTWGFPAITHFLGFTHALSRKLSSSYQGLYNTEFNGCAVICHDYHNKVYKPKKGADFEFLQSKNPPVLKKNKAFSPSPPIIEEGKMNLTVSLVIELGQSLNMTLDEISRFEQDVFNYCCRMRVAGGNVLNISKVHLLSGETTEQRRKMLMRLKRLTLPGVVLIDRSEYLQQHFEALKELDNNFNPELFDAWLDYSALKYKAVPHMTKEQTTPDINTKADWKYISKPYTGWLVPLMIGFKAISKEYEAGVIKNTRDESTPTKFVEAIHSVGEWFSVHKITDIEPLIWHHQHDNQWYLCRQKSNQQYKQIITTESDISGTVLNFNDAFANI